MTDKIRSPLSIARGLGSAHDGTKHWWAQRISAVALIPLTMWFMTSVSGAVLSDHAAMLDWLHSGFNTVMLSLLLVALFWHAKLGIEVVIEDYVHEHGAKLACLLVARGGLLVAGALCLVSVLKIHLTS